MKKIRWGVAGPGVIAQKFAEAIAGVDCAELYAVASRSGERAEAFAEKYGAKKAYSSYSEMAEDENVDVVYISTAHPFHRPVAEIFIKAGKHILCEKPLCVCEEDGRALTALAEEKGVFLMEAMWTSFLPAVKALKEEIRAGVIGKPMGMTADFCYSIEREEDPKLFEKELAGGSLLDVGVYCVHFALDIFGEPTEINAAANVCSGVDLHTQMTFKYGDGEIAALSSAIKLEKPYDAYIYGTKGRIYVPSFYKAAGYTVTLADGSVTEREYPYGDNGFEFEIEEVCRCIEEGRLQSATVSHADSLCALRRMDRVKELIGI